MKRAHTFLAVSFLLVAPPSAMADEGTAPHAKSWAEKQKQEEIGRQALYHFLSDPGVTEEDFKREFSHLSEDVEGEFAKSYTPEKRWADFLEARSHVFGDEPPAEWATFEQVTQMLDYIDGKRDNEWMAYKLEKVGDVAAHPVTLTLSVLSALGAGAYFLRRRKPGQDDVLLPTPALKT